MEQKNNPKDIPATMIVRSGTEVKIDNISLKKLCKKYGIKYEQVYYSLHFDWNPNTTGFIQAVDPNESIAHDEFFQAVIDTKPQILLDAEKQGHLWVTDEDFHRNPGVAEDWNGAGGKPPIGYLFAALNSDRLCTHCKKLMQAIQDYARTIVIAADGDTPQRHGRIPISVVISTVGAMGTGSLVWFLNEGIPSCAQETGIKPKVTVHLMMRGNFDTKDSRAARLNEYITLKHLQARGSGKYVDPFTGRILRAPFTNCFLYSNVNDYGNFTDFNQLLYHQAHSEFFLWSTPAGNRMRERACDIEGISFNEYGDPLCGQTFSVSLLTRNSQRVIRFCTLMAVALFCEQLLAKPSRQKHIEEAVSLAHHEKLVESQDENLLTADLIRPEELNRENILQQSRESVTDRVGSSRGFQRAAQLDEAISDILNNDIESLYIPAMKKQAALRLEKVQKRISDILAQKLMTQHGMMEILQLLSTLRQLIQDFQEMLQAKSVQIQDYLTPHQMIVADASERLAHLQERPLIMRLFSFFQVRRICRSLHESGMASIAHQLELSCCNIGELDVLVALLEFLDKKIAWLTSTLRKISNIARSSKNQIDKLVGEDTSFENPNGFELTTPAYLEKFLTDYARRQSGTAAFKDQLFGTFLDTYQSMDVFLKMPQAELETILQNLYEPIFAPVVRATTVWDEFEKTYPDLYTQQEILTQLIHHSEGRVICEDNIGQDIVWVKTANVPDSSCITTVRQFLQTLDKKSGPWEIVKHGDIDSLVIGQLRGAISLSPFIRRLNIPDNRIGWKTVAQLAVDVVSALMVPPNPNLSQFRRMLVKAIAANLLVCKEGCFYLEGFLSEPLSLGSDFTSVKKILSKRWRDIVFIESTYARNLIVDENHVLSRLDDILNTKDLRSSLIDKQSVQDCCVLTEIMLPHLRRMRVAALREEQL